MIAERRWSRVVRSIDLLERTEAPAVAWVAAFLACVLVRGILEVALEYPAAAIVGAWLEAGPSGQSDVALVGGAAQGTMMLLHWPAFYAAVLLALVLALSSLSGERPTRTARAVLLCFPLVWLPPIVDAVVTGGAGYTLDYNRTLSLSALLGWFYWPGRSIAGVSPGIRVEILIASAGAGLYILAKGAGVVRAAAAFVAATLIPAILGSLPAFAERAFLARDGAGSVHGRVAIAYLVLIVLLGALLAWRADPPRARAALSNLRWPRALHYVVFAGLGLLVAVYEFPGGSHVGADVLVAAAGVLLAVFFAFEFNVQVNDLADADIDRISNPERPLVRGTLSCTDVRWLAAIYFILSVAFASAVHTTALLLVLVYDALGLLYSARPFRLHRLFPLSTLVLAGCALAAMVAGFSVLAGSNAVLFFPRGAALLVTVLFTLGLNFKDLKDVEGDRAAGLRTLPVLLGRTRGKWAIALLVLVAYAAVPPLVGRGGWLWLAPVAGTASAWMIVRREHPHEPSLFAVYFGFVAFAVALLVAEPHAPAFRPANLGFQHLLDRRPQDALDAFAADGGSASERAAGTMLAHLLAGDARAAVEEGRAADAPSAAPHVALLYAYALAADDRTAEAETAYRDVVRRFPRSAGARFNLGNLAFSRGDVTGAAAEYRAALDIRADWGEARFNLANALLRMDQAPEAEQEYRRALALLGPRANIHNNLGLALERLGDVARAEAEYGRALTLDPDLAVARANQERARARLRR